jgi:hypothetical protein
VSNQQLMCFIDYTVTDCHHNTNDRYTVSCLRWRKGVEGATDQKCEASKLDGVEQFIVYRKRWQMLSGNGGENKYSPSIYKCETQTPVGRATRPHDSFVIFVYIIQHVSVLFPRYG